MVDRLLCKLAFAAAVLMASLIYNHALKAQPANHPSVDQGSSQPQIAAGITCINAFTGQPPQSFEFQIPPSDPVQLKTLPSTDPTVIVNAIEETVGLARRIGVYPAKGIDTACATIVRQNERRVYYGTDWLERYSNGSYWIKLGVLAHEIGHHVNFHTVDDTLSAWKKEYQADVFLGRVVRLMGGSVEDAVSAVSRVEPIEGDDVHPPRILREAAIRSGYDGTKSPAFNSPKDSTSIWNSAGTYCDDVVRLLLKTTSEYTLVKDETGKSVASNLPRQLSVDPNAAPRLGTIDEKLFNPVHDTHDQCQIAEVPGYGLAGICRSRRNNLEDFKIAFGQALEDIRKCLPAHDWRPVSTTFASADTGLPDTEYYIRFFGSDVAGGPPEIPQRVMLTRSQSRRSEFELRWEVRPPRSVR
jgi:hypothetical protein